MVKIVVVTCSLSAIFIGFLLYREMRKKHIEIWLTNYIRQSFLRLWSRKPSDLAVIFCWVDHFEPMWNGAEAAQQQKRMENWFAGYPKLADRHRDSLGRVLQHSWFYPGEDFYDCHVKKLCELCRQGYGEIEFHHHHHNQTSASLRQQFAEAFANFARHEVLVGEDDRRYYGFIHGNMGLDNARGPEWCGVNDELTILGETGCYADFSYPVAPCVSQTKKINSIYYVKDDPLRPKSQEHGRDVRVGGNAWGDIMMIQGPLCLNWQKRKYGILPTIENSEIQQSNPGTPYRMDNWVRQHIHVQGHPEWVFVKVSCHGAPEENFSSCLGDEADTMLSYLEKRYGEGRTGSLHYVTAREMYNIIKAAEAGKNGNPDNYRNFALPPPRYISGSGREGES